MTSKPAIVMKPVEWLKPYGKNAKHHPDEQIDRLSLTIKRFGWDQPIVAESDGTIIKGHGRRLAALKLGMSEVPVLVRDDLTKEEADAARIADNAVIGLQFDTRTMQEELQRLMSSESIDLEIDDLGLSSKDRDLLMASLDEANADAVMEDTHAEIERQKDEDAERVEKSDAEEVTLTQAFGFKSLTRAQARSVSRAMAMAEIATGKLAGEAFSEWLETVL
jgi:hypothetical protein